MDEIIYSNIQAKILCWCCDSSLNTVGFTNSCDGSFSNFQDYCNSISGTTENTDCANL